MAKTEIEKRNKQIPSWDRIASSMKGRFKIRLYPVVDKEKNAL